MRDEIQAENDRVLGILKDLVRASRLTIRAVERKAGVSYTVFQKVLSGSTTLQFHHILKILQAIGMSRSEFFNRCYPERNPVPPTPPAPPKDPKNEVTVATIHEAVRKLFDLLGFNLPRPTS